MARKRDRHDEAEPVEDVSAEGSTSLSTARQAFLAGEITWRQYVEAEGS